MITEGDLNLNTYLTELLRMTKPQQQTSTFRFPTPEKPGKKEPHTLIQKRILAEMTELKEKEKLNPTVSAESGMKLLERFDLTDTLLILVEKQAVEDKFFEYHDIFARHRKDIGMNTEFKVKLTLKLDRAVYSQSPPMPIHVKEALFVQLALMHK